MLGYLKLPNSFVNGLRGKEYNLWEPARDCSKKIFVSQNAQDVTPDPDHGIPATMTQSYATFKPVKNGEAASMGGFVMDAKRMWGNDRAPRVMECWNISRVPIIAELAEHFVLFDQWHASVPGPTFPNREYFHSGTSAGECEAKVPSGGFNQTTLYELLDNAGYDWAFYFEDMLDAAIFEYTRRPQFASRLRYFTQFAVDAANGNLPTVSFISPRYASVMGIPANDQHPPHSVALGEKLMKDVYEQLRQSPSWESSALLLTYDEHGGFYDHVPLPMDDIPNPDGKNCNVPAMPGKPAINFSFDRLGVRVPAILISPWVNHEVVSRSPASSGYFEHTSWIASLTAMLDLPGNLTRRTAWASTFDYLFDRSAPRNDTPYSLSSIHIDGRLSGRDRMADYSNEAPNELILSYLKVHNDWIGLSADANLNDLHHEWDASLYSSLLREKRNLPHARK